MNIPFRDLSDLQHIPHAERRDLPGLSAVYFLIGAGDVISKPAGSVLYVGETGNLRNRWRSHSINRLALYRSVSSDWVIAWIEVAPNERQMVELACLLKWQPPYSRDMYALPAVRAAEMRDKCGAG